MMDNDLQEMNLEHLVDEVKKLRAGIREHRDCSGQDLCWHHPKLWDMLPEKVEPKIYIPDWPEFMRGCVHYRKSLESSVAMFHQEKNV